MSGNRDERALARKRLTLVAPLSDDGLGIQDQVAQLIGEADRRADTRPNELLSGIFDAVARKYFGRGIQGVITYSHQRNPKFKA